MLSAELLQKIRRIEIRASHLVTETLAGEYQSSFKGRGIVFEDTRPYVPGDDVRLINWNLMARTGDPHIKNFREERELSVVIAVDVSASGVFGTKTRMKKDAALEVAAVLAHLAMKKNDKVGLLLFSDQVEKFIPPKKGRAHLWQLVQTLLTFKPRGKCTKLSTALEFLNCVLKKKAVVFVVSDFLDQGFEADLSRTRQNHDTIAVRIKDTAEKQINVSGIVAFEDPETGECLTVDLHREGTRQAIAKNWRLKDDLFLKMLRKARLDLVEIESSSTSIDPLFHFFRRRMRRKG